MDWPIIKPDAGRKPFVTTIEESVRKLGILPPLTDTFAETDRIKAMPIWIPSPMLAKRIALLNGSAVAGNVDVGIYTAELWDPAAPKFYLPKRLIVNKGLTAQAGTNQFQVFDIADTYLAPGHYFLAVYFSSASAKYLSNYGGWDTFNSGGFPASPASFSQYVFASRTMAIMSVTGVA